MSAIAGILYQGSPEEAILPGLLKKMEHRGEDQQQFFYHEEAAIALGSPDTTSYQGMAQALMSKDKKLTLICDGDMNQLNNSQYENILEWYQQKGIDFLRDLTGPFALIIMDERGKEPLFIVARDTLGGKPLYYAKRKGTYLFSSEMKSLTDYYQTVHSFPPGHYYQSDRGFIEYDRVVPSGNKIKVQESNLLKVADGIRHRLSEAVAYSLQGEQSVGLMISGGLDSSLVAALAMEMDSRPRKSFCVGSSDASDLPAAREVARALGTEHYEYEYILEEMIELLPRVIYHLESFEPSLARSAVPNYFAFRMAAQHTDIVLSGEGADELFSGYEYLKNISDSEELDKELVRVINTLHSIGLQRGDRMSAANGIEVRTPFLDQNLMDYALRIPAGWKLRKTSSGIVEKWILREAFDSKTKLPDHILWREKEEFSEGSGARDSIQVYMEESIQESAYQDAVKEIAQTDDIQIRSKEELYYYRIFKSFYPHRELAQQVGRWAVD